MLYFLLTTAAVIAFGQASIYNWQEKPYGNNDFNIKSEFGHDAILECNDTRMPDTFSMKYWIRPDLKIMKPGDSDFFDTPLDGRAGWQVNETAMHIINVHGDHFGLYYCVGEVVPDSPMIIKKGLNYQGPYFGDLWPEYEMNVIIGCSAAGGLAVIIVVIYIISLFYFNPEEERLHSASFDMSLPGSSSMGDEGSLEMKKANGLVIEDMTHDLDNEIQTIFTHQQAKF